MQAWASLRALGLLRRIAKALELTNDLKREELGLAFPAWGGRTRKRPKLVRIEQASVEDWNESYREERRGER
jgi:hypothetical protein